MIRPYVAVCRCRRAPRRTLPQCFAGNAAGDYNVLAGKASWADNIGGSERKEVPCTDKIDSYRGFCKTDYDEPGRKNR